jgi:hypothetical protein
MRSHKLDYDARRAPSHSRIMTHYLPSVALAVAALTACTRAPEPHAPAEEPSAAVAAIPASAAERQPGESAASFAGRHTPMRGDVVEHAAEVALSGGVSGVAAFYMRPDALQPDPSATELAGYLFVPAGPRGYTRVLIDSIGPEGGTPRLEHLFLANADRDPEPELLFIISWLRNHYDVRGTGYATYAYDAPDAQHPPQRLTPVPLSRELQDECDCEWRDGRRQRARFTTPEAVKAALAEMSR